MNYYDDKLRKKVLRLTNKHCYYCGITLSMKRKFPKCDKYTIDHLIPLSKGGADSIENMIPACRWCNHTKKMTQSKNSV